MLTRLQKILTQSGTSSRRKAEEYILAGRVAVDGKTVNTLGTKVDPERCRVFLDGKPLRFEKKVYILLNKPKGYLCTKRDTHNRPTVFNLTKGLRERVFTVGRLDKDTEGLLLLTNDGSLAHRLMHPSYKIDKIYKVQLAGSPLPHALKRLEKGIVLEGKKTAPCRIRPSRYPKEIYITLHEGRKRQVKKMLDAIGCRAITLKRINYGPLTLGNLKPGRFRHLTASEIKKLKG